MPGSYPRYVEIDGRDDDDDVLHVLVDGEQYEVEDDGEETEEEHAEEDADSVLEVQSPRASQTGPSASASSDGARNWVEEEEDKRRRTEGGEASSSNGVGSVEISQGVEWNRNEIDGLFCPICMEAWTNYGDHHICCLPCGHLYGMSCINKWLQQRRNAGKCPQCNRKCSLKDVRKIFASRIVAADEESQKRIQSLEATCASLEKKNTNWCRKEVEWKKREAALQLEVRELTERTNYLEHLLEDSKRKPGLANLDCNFQEHSCGLKFSGQVSTCSFILEKDLPVDGARLIDVDASNQVVLVARRQSGFGGTHVLTKISLMSPHESEDMTLPYCNNAVKDLHISPAARNLVLFSSLGKKLAILSMESNHIILDYDLPYAAWSCSWDQNNSHHVYAGLKNGLFMVFDMRQTVGPLKTFQGLTSNPVHTIHSLSSTSTLSNDVRSVLSASAYGVCRWTLDALEEGPFLVPETNQGVCTSLAYCSSRGEIVASYRPKVGTSSETAYTQLSPAPSHTAGHRVEGCHVAFKKERNFQFSKLGSGYANIDTIRLPKSAIIDFQDCSSMFVSGDSVMGELTLHELTSFRSVQRLKVHKHPVRDVKYSYGLGRGLLSCISDDILQLFITEG
ncbi:E3 ubiquitin-protein ligase RFWD3 isoform X1 [Momordica charantia]|uniref:RING-type E3 ubiquitin transferase n=1 Tax=Momordica charantia TaxID=3673 RepID=A0A6J1CQ96_MOMCH|nr:E3 ubiquitin-protein ligase RFWD3 isoform X1 [Momordica charantia]